MRITPPPGSRANRTGPTENTYMSDDINPYNAGSSKAAEQPARPSPLPVGDPLSVNFDATPENLLGLRLRPEVLAPVVRRQRRTAFHLFAIALIAGGLLWLSP